jgi:nucleoside-diphosphate-sugar epimerase
MNNHPFASVLVSGANGFVGRVLASTLTRRGYAAYFAVRAANSRNQGNERVIGAISGSTDWSAALRNVDVVIHLAARVHVMDDVSIDPLAEFRKVNVQGTENLARQAAKAGVKRFVFVSSIKVNGEQTVSGQKFSEDNVPAPSDAYGISKWEAEQALHQISRETGLEVVILRLPLVYGPGVKGNFIQMMKAVSAGIPLPLASVRNSRSLVYLGNLVDALIACATHPAAAGQTYLISDGEDVSTPELLRRLAGALGVPARLFPFPPSLLKFAGMLTGKSAQVDRLLGSLQVDSSKIRQELGWQPPFSMAQGLKATAEWYRAQGAGAR